VGLCTYYTSSGKVIYTELMIEKLQSLLSTIGFSSDALRYLLLFSALFFVMVLYSLNLNEQYPTHTIIALSISCSLVFILVLLSVFISKKRKVHSITETDKSDNDKQRSITTALRTIKVILASFAMGFAMLLVLIVGLFIVDSQLAKSVMTKYLPMLWLLLAVFCSPWMYKKIS
jgi:hypothetical protein